MAPSAGDPPHVVMVMGCRSEWLALRQRLMEDRLFERTVIVGCAGLADELEVLPCGGHARAAGGGCPVADLGAMLERLEEMDSDAETILIDATADSGAILATEFTHAAAIMSNEIVALVDAAKVLKEGLSDDEELQIRCADRVILASCHSVGEEELLEVESQLSLLRHSKIPITQSFGAPEPSDLLKACEGGGTACKPEARDFLPTASQS